MSHCCFLLGPSVSSPPEVYSMHWWLSILNPHLSTWRPSGAASSSPRAAEKQNSSSKGNLQVYVHKFRMGLSVFAGLLFYLHLWIIFSWFWGFCWIPEAELCSWHQTPSSLVSFVSGQNIRVGLHFFRETMRSTWSVIFFLLDKEHASLKMPVSPGKVKHSCVWAVVWVRSICLCLIRLPRQNYSSTLLTFCDEVNYLKSRFRCAGVKCEEGYGEDQPAMTWHI